MADQLDLDDLFAKYGIARTENPTDIQKPPGPKPDPPVTLPSHPKAQLKKEFSFDGSTGKAILKDVDKASVAEKPNPQSASHQTIEPQQDPSRRIPPLSYELQTPEASAVIQFSVTGWG